MNLQIFGTKKCALTRKTERFFKERGIKFHPIDLAQKGMSAGELRNVANRVGGAEARKEIAEMTEQKVHLFLFVKVREGWGDDPERYRAMGIEFPKE